jgi:hypothetical protein
MLAELPIKLQIRVIQYLAADNFPEAKKLHDQWLYAQKQHSITHRYQAS